MIITKNIEIPVKATYDVIVVGGGPSGCGAAFAAAQNGAKVLIIEQMNTLGGQWTSGFINPMFDGINKKGILKDIITELHNRNAWGGFWDKSFHYEYMKLILEEYCENLKIDVLYGTTYTGVLQVGNTVNGVTTISINGHEAFLGKIIIDTTGDASVAVDAGAEWQIGGNNETDCQSMTLMFLIGNIPEKYKDGLMFIDVLDAAYKKEGLGRAPIFRVPYIIPAPRSNFGVVQLTHMRGYSPLSATERTKAVLEGRRQMIEAFEVLTKFDPDFKDLCLIQSAPSLGVRESRRIVGDYTLTEQELLEGAKFDDGICTCGFGIDIHNNESTKQTVIHTKPYQIPFRCLLPKGLENIIVAGKTISGTHTAMASYRVTGNCFAMGEAAGKAAAYCVKHGCKTREVPAEIIKEAE